MKGVILTVLALLISAATLGQQQKIDSLKSVIDNYKTIDTNYVNMRLDYFKNKMFHAPNDSTWLGFALKTLKVSEKLKYKKGIVLSYERLGIYYHSIITDAPKAANYYYKAIKVAESQSDLKKHIPAFYANIGLIYYEQQEYKKAINALRPMANSTKVEYKLNAYYNIANSFTELNQVDSASVYFNKTITTAKTINSNLILALAHSNLSLLQSRIGKNTEALKNTEASLNLVNQHNIEFARPTVNANAAMAYLANKDYNNAEKYANNALKAKSLKSNLYVQKSLWGTLAEVYEEKKEYAKALNAYHKTTALKDSLVNTDRKLEIAKRDIAFESDKQQALAQAEIKRQKLLKNGSILGGSLLLASAIFGLIVYKRKRDAVSKKQEAEFNETVANTQLKALRAQMNPHFIFNSLNSINDYIAKNDAAAASKYLTKFAKIMRQTLENSNKKEITLQDDLQLIELYLQIEAMRLNHKFSYSIKVNKNIDVENTLVPPLILQPFIENSIWHGISKKDGKGHITISIQKEGNMIVCDVEDDGVGLNNSKQDTGKIALGQSITKERIDIINKVKNAKGSVKVENKSNRTGVKVEVKLPLELAF